VTFTGDIADYYASFRRGFGPAALAFVVNRLEVGPGELVMDLGCGTGQLAVPISSHVRHVLGVDPEPDMLAHARDAARRQGASGRTSWMLGSDAGVPGLAGLLGKAAVDVMTISNAVHFMDTKRLFDGLPGVLAPGGRVAVIANGTPIWLQDSSWSRGLRRFLEQRFDSDLSGSCYTDDSTLARCRQDLEAAGFTTAEHTMSFREAVSADWLFGNLMSAVPLDWLPAHNDRPAFAADLTDALRSGQAAGDFVDDVRISIVLGRH
jgi:ubiquinone/menaquinone biosynthesis C-methylase UbiE